MRESWTETLNDTLSGLGSRNGQLLNEEISQNINMSISRSNRSSSGLLYGSLSSSSSHRNM